MTLKQLKSLIADVEVELESKGFDDMVEVKIDSLSDIKSANMGFHDNELYEPFVFIGLNIEDSKWKSLLVENLSKDAKCDHLIVSEIRNQFGTISGMECLLCGETLDV